MTKPGYQRQRFLAGSFKITEPKAGDTVVADGFGTVFVEVEDESGGAIERFEALIVPSGSGSATAGVRTVLTRNGTSAFYWGRVPAGILPGDKTLTVWPFEAGAEGNPRSVDFTANVGGSGSSGTATLGACGFCSGTPVPVMLQLINHHASIANPDPGAPQGCDNCAALNADAFLVYTEGCKWYSASINYCGSDSGRWMLEKVSARVWDLTLLLEPPETEAFGVVRYTHSTASDNDCAFPIELAFAELLTDPSCVGWPATIQIVPAT